MTGIVSILQDQAPPSTHEYNEGVMARQLEAVYEHVMLRPLESLVLSEHQRVRLTIEEKTAELSWESPEPVNERREELRWLAGESGPYAGDWVALDGPILVAHGESSPASAPQPERQVSSSRSSLVFPGHG